MEFFLLFQQLFLTAFVTLVLSFFLTKFFLSPTSSDYVNKGQKGDQETVKLNKVLKVSGVKSKRKRVRFADDGDDDHGVVKVGEFSGFEGKVGDFSGFEESVSEFSGGLEVGLKDDGLVFDGLGDQREVGCGGDVEVVEELGVEERFDIEGGILDSGFEKSVKLLSDDVGGEGSELMEMVVEDNENERDLENQDLGDVNVAKKNSCEMVVDDKCVGVAAGDGDVHDQSGEVEAPKESVGEERSVGDSKDDDVVNAAFDRKNCFEEVDIEKRVGLGYNDVLEDHTGEVRVLKDLVSADSIVERVIKEENIVDSANDEVVISEMVGNDTSVTLASACVVVDQSEDVRVVEVSQGTVVENVEKGDSAGKGLVSDEDDDWEGIERSDLEKVFAAAANYVDSGGKADKLLNLGNDEQMQLYALHKIAMEGPCYEGQPMALKISARAKWY